MYPITAAVAAVLSGTARIGAHIDVMRAGAIIPGFGGIPVERASMTADRTSSNRRTGSVKISDPVGTYAPKLQTDPLGANGNEVRLYCDVFIPGVANGFPIPMGTFTIVETVVVDTGADFNITVELSDRSWALQQRGFVLPYTIAAAQNVDVAIMAMLNAAWSGNGRLISSLAPVDALTPSPAGIVQPGSSGDPWTQATRLGDAAGIELFFDALGILNGRPTPDPSQQAPVWSVTELAPTGLKGVTAKFTRKGVSSAWEIVGKGVKARAATGGTKSIVGPTSISYVQDNDPRSPTYAQGPFGVVPQITKSTLVTSKAQGLEMASTQRAQQKGMASAVTISILPNPALDIDDVVYVQRSRMGLAGLYVIDSITTDVHHDATMQIAVRTVI